MRLSAGCWTGGDTIEISVPSQIQIGGRTYRLELTPHLVADTGNRAEVCNPHCVIRVEQRQSAELRMAGLLHELVHAIGAIYLGSEDFINEAMTESLANGLHQVLGELGIKLVWQDSCQVVSGGE